MRGSFREAANRSHITQEDGMSSNEHWKQRGKEARSVHVATRELQDKREEECRSHMRRSSSREVGGASRM